MLAFFPHPYPDEILYSVFARYHRWSGNIEAKITQKELFGSITVSAIVDFPSHLKALMDRLPLGATYELTELVENHTMFPLYAPFLPVTRAQKILQAMYSDKGNSIYLTTGVMASAVSQPSFLRFCPQCIKEDQMKWGEPYWHRAHQFPGVLVCPIHGSPIYDSSAKLHEFNKHIFVAATKEICNANPECEIQYNNYMQEKLMKVATEVNWLLLQKGKSISDNDFREKYFQFLKQKDLLIGKSAVDQKELAN